MACGVCGGDHPTERHPVEAEKYMAYVSGMRELRRVCKKFAAARGISVENNSIFNEMDRVIRAAEGESGDEQIGTSPLDDLFTVID